MEKQPIPFDINGINVRIRARMVDLNRSGNPIPAPRSLMRVVTVPEMAENSHSLPHDQKKKTKLN